MSVYELNAGDGMAEVETFCRHLAGTAGFGTATIPSLVQVQRYQDMGHAKIAAFLSTEGLDAAQSGSSTVAFLQHLNALETVISLELSFPITGPGEPNERFMAFRDEREAMYQLIKDGGLGPDATGETGESGLVGVTGVSIDRKVSVESDTDLVPARFKRGQFQVPENRPSTRLSADTLG